MKTGVPGYLRRSTSVGVAGILVAVLAACTGHGGGTLPPGLTASDAFPGTAFTGKASFGFSFSCEDKGGVNPPTGRLRIQLAYTDHGTSPLPLGAPFSIHGIVDDIDPVMESVLCSGQNPPPGGKKLIFLGRYRLTTSPPPGVPTTCRRSEASTPPLCRFEVIVRDNDGNLAPSKRDFFSIKLSSAEAVTSDLDATTVFYARAGLLAAGNLTVQ